MSLDERNDKLEKKIAESPLEQAVQALFKADIRRKMQVRILTISVVLDIVLTLGITGLSIKTNELAHLSQTNRNAVIANCETSNDSRRNNRALWDYLLSLPPTKPPTAAEQVQIDQFKGFVAKTFAQRDCQAEITKQ